MMRLRSLLFNALFLLWSVGMHIISLPLLFGPGAGIYLVGGFWARGCVLLLRAVCGLGYRIEGLENLPDQPVVIAAKHQSIWETLAFCHIFQRPIFVLKQELLRIPFYGWYLKRMGMIAIDRDGGAGALRRMLAEARQTLDAGKHIIIFPEGTRTKPGQRRPYHPGVAALYKQLGVPVLPVALNSGLVLAGQELSTEARPDHGQAAAAAAPGAGPTRVHRPAGAGDRRRQPDLAAGSGALRRRACG